MPRLGKPLLTRDEVHRADTLALRTMMAVLLKEFLAGTPDRDAAANNLRAAAEGAIRALPNSSIVPVARKAAYIKCAIDSAHRMVANAQTLEVTGASWEGSPG